jgi:hypothetical protein
MEAEHPTHSWEAMQDGQVFYRRQHVYDIAGKLPNLDDYIVAGARNGGPLGAPALSFSHRVHAGLGCAQR